MPAASCPRRTIALVVSGDELRGVMRRFPAGIAVLTLNAEGQRFGITVGSLVSLSLDPPLVGATIGRDSAAHELLRTAGGFSVSLLSEEQLRLAQHFARGVPPIGLWVGIAHREAASGAPLLDGALGWLDCDVWAEYDAGDHTFFVGLVTHVELGERRRGIVYRDGAYHPA